MAFLVNDDDGLAQDSTRKNNQFQCNSGYVLGSVADQLELVCQGRKETRDKLILSFNVFFS